MFFFLTSFCGDQNALSPTPTDVSNIDHIEIENALYDDLLVKSSVDSVITPDFPTQWDFDILMYARFKNNLIAGNIDAALAATTGMRLKRRKKGTFDWITLYEVFSQTNDVNDYLFEFYDRTVRSGVEYDYALIPICNNIEGMMSISTVKCEFDGLCILDPFEAFITDMDIEISTQRNSPSAAVTPIDSKYPYVVRNGRANYVSGNLSAFFLPRDFATKDLPVNFEGGHTYRENLMDFLLSGRAKLLKMSDGRMWLIDVEDSPNESYSEHENKIITSFSWIEVGDCEDAQTLYYSGYINALPASN